ncbi:MAG TPA: hypothetical protein VF195_07320 [Actinomycetota bacterium]
MRTLRAVTAALLLALLHSGSAACTSSNGGPSVSASPSLDVAPGGYVYRSEEIEATIEITGEAGTLTVFNGTGFPLDDPGVYLLDARDGSRVDAEVIDAAPVPDGETGEFEVTIPGAPEAKHVGLIVLLAGDADLGAFVPAGDQA